MRNARAKELLESSIARSLSCAQKFAGGWGILFPGRGNLDRGERGFLFFPRKIFGVLAYIF
jgi:hypothetical protein